jgi:hypothetical protein
MIIRFPTGLYKSILPKNGQAGNITYTISTQDPPSVNVRLTQFPPGEELQPSPEKIFDDRTRREQFGELIYTVAKNSRSTPGSNVKQFELGEILEFEQNPPETTVVPLSSPRALEIRHDTNLIDLASLGLTQSEIDELTVSSEEKQRSLEQEFNLKNSEAKNLETNIVENQKKINETNKALKATREIFDIPDGGSSDEPIFQKLSTLLDQLSAERDVLISDRNDLVVELKDISKAIVRVSEFVR